MQRANFQRGFTLLELLVVTAIIAILSSILYVGFDSAREVSRNRVLISEVKEVQLAIELYKAQNGQYPATTGDLVPDFIAGIPEDGDSMNSNCAIEYQTGASNEWYKLTARECLAGDTTITINDELARCPTSCATCAGDANNTSYQESDAFAKSFAIYSLGGQCE